MDDELYMTRCLQLSRLGKGYVAPNPLVGAVLVADRRIIGEGFHGKFGEAHAEVNCLKSVQDTDRHLISASILYVSLEPCSHFGKTPPCTELIISNNIGKVVIGIRDPFPEVDGKGIERLQHEGIEVVTGVLKDECREINKYFFHFHQQRRPYIILKWAQSADRKIATSGPERTFISNTFTNRLVHQLRSEVMAIMVGSNTVLMDDPALTTRDWPGTHPLRIVIDPNNKVDESKKVLDGSTPTIVFNSKREEEKKNVRYIKITQEEQLIPEILQQLFILNIHSLLVEGGAKLLQTFIDAGAWDEARVITNESLVISEGLPAPVLPDHEEFSVEMIGSDTLKTFNNRKNK